MRKFILLFVAFATLNLSIFATTPLTRGTMLNVKLMSGINSQSGDSPRAYVADDVRNAAGKVVIKQNTPVMLGVERTEARGVGRPGEVRVRCLSTSTVDGQTVTLEGTMEQTGKSKKGLAIGLGVGLGLFTLVGLACLAIKGGKAEMPSGTVIPNVMVTNDYQVAD